MPRSFLRPGLPAGGELGHRAAGGRLRCLAARVGVDLRVEHQDVDVAAGGEDVVHAAEADVVATGKTSQTSFMTVYLLESVPAIIIVVTITGYIQLMLSLMVIYPIVIIPSLYFLGKLVSDKKVMSGYQYNKYEVAAFVIASIMIVAGGILGLYALL